MRSPESDRYAADYEAGALARDQAHERLNAVCAAARRTDALLKREYATRGPAKAVVFGEERELLPVNGMAQNRTQPLLTPRAGCGVRAAAGQSGPVLMANTRHQ